ncbi:hypothetical protein ACO0QE_003462 [Hanseniaspora vineae]
MNAFKLGEHLTKFQTAEKDTLGEGLQLENAQSDLNEIIDKLALSPADQIEDEEVFDTLLDLCHAFANLNLKQQTQLTYSLGSSIVNLSKSIQRVLLSGQNKQSDDEDISLGDWLLLSKSQLQKFGYLIHVCLTFLQLQLLRSNSSATSTSSRKRGGANSSSHGGNQEDYQNIYRNSCSQLEGLLEIIIRLCELNLSKIFQTSLEKDQFLSLFLKPVYLFLEIENLVKVHSIKFLTTKLICVAVKMHNQSPSVLNMVMTNLTYFVNLSNYLAELLQVLSNEYDFPQLTEEVLREISNKNFSAKDNTGPKSISGFLIRVSELVPKIVLRQMTLLIRLLNNSSFTLRCAVVEVCGNIVLNSHKNVEQEGNAELLKQQQVEVLIELLEERFLDTNPYVRTKAIQAFMKICDLEATRGESQQFSREKVKWAKLAVRSLQDKSSLVRRNCVKLLSKLVLVHPFSALHGSQLSLSQWEKRYSEANLVFTKMDHECDVSMDDAEQEKSIDSQKMKLTIKYYEEAIEFIKTLHLGINHCCKLLYSKNKTEVIEAMDFFVLTDAYDVEVAYTGIKKMLHLVWMKSSNDEGVSIPQHLVHCYKQLFLTAPDSCNYKEKAAYISKNLIQLTVDASVADLASLEKLLGLLYEEKFIDHNVINVLWAIYNNSDNAFDDRNISTNESLSKEQVHGSIIVLGMLTLVDSQIAGKNLDYLLNVGLGEAGEQDLILSRYTCLALERSFSNSMTTASSSAALRELEIVSKLRDRLLKYTEDTEYFPLCESALNALFTISSHPDVACSEIIKLKTQETFGTNEIHDTRDKEFSRLVSLSQLLFLVGQVSIKMIVYLERCEAEFKKRKNSKPSGSKKKGSENPHQNQQQKDATGDKELEMIGGSNEDDFADAVIAIKENELLFGDQSLLAQFGPVVEEIVSDNSGKFQHEILQRVATLCLEKMMCCSSKYCEKNLPLLITVMEKSPDAVIRSNAVLGLGDMAVCFNNLVDENTEFLYKRLHDESLMVQRTCLMTVTFLILAGQVKVKGQLGQMAKCLENEDQRISDMCRLFFTELASKDNAIYNGFIDIFSTLTADQTLSQPSFKKIIQFLISFIDKERHQKQLSGKLLNRLKQCETQKQWDDVAFVLNNFPYKSEQIDEVLKEGFKLVTTSASTGTPATNETADDTAQLVGDTQMTV